MKYVFDGEEFVEGIIEDFFNIVKKIIVDILGVIGYFVFLYLIDDKVIVLFIDGVKFEVKNVVVGEYLIWVY